MDKLKHSVHLQSPDSVEMLQFFTWHFILPLERPAGILELEL